MRRRITIADSRFTNAAAITWRRRRLVTRFDIAHCFRTYTLTLPNILDCIGRFDAAAEALGEALRLAPKHSGYLTNLGLIQQRQHKLDEAEPTFQAVLAKEPS